MPGQVPATPDKGSPERSFTNTCVSSPIVSRQTSVVRSSPLTSVCFSTDLDRRCIRRSMSAGCSGQVDVMGQIRMALTKSKS